jgi:UDP-N-acetylglucosamine transferase subunit ALG13
MIFVTVGTDTHQLNRLLEEIDRLVENGMIKGRVVAQTGNSTYIPKHYEHYNFLSSDKMSNCIRKSDVVVSHAGIGSIITAREFRRPIVVVPRLKRYGEHTDDHQVQIAKELGRQGKVFAVFDIRDLLTSIKKAKRSKVKDLGITKMAEMVSEYLSKAESES